jgi:hypothetical protein
LSQTAWGNSVPFAFGLQSFLRNRTSRVPMECAAGESLQEVLGKHLLAVESTAQTVLLTSVLVLDSEGRRLWHAASPSLPREYREAIDGVEIGPNVGSCGTAAFEGHAIYVPDIATDPLWADYRHLALPHGLRACWSTPIHDSGGSVVGTFAVYHLTPRSPTREEVDAINMITGHVAQAIEWFRHAQDLDPNAAGTGGTRASLPLAANEKASRDPAKAAEARDTLRSIEADFGSLADAIERAILAFPDLGSERLNRIKEAAQRGAQIARKSIEPD